MQTADEKTGAVAFLGLNRDDVGLHAFASIRSHQRRFVLEVLQTVRTLLLTVWRDWLALRLKPVISRRGSQSSADFLASTVPPSHLNNRGCQTMLSPLSVVLRHHACLDLFPATNE
jgi:hypothetical protein